MSQYEQSLQQAALLFEENPNYGSLKCPTTEGLVALTMLGKDIWNAWTNKYSFAELNFTNAVFEKSMDFSGYIFTENDHDDDVAADFSGANFLEKVSFKGVIFGGRPLFFGTKFHSFCDFSDLRFDGCNFNGAIFEEDAVFSRVELFARSAVFKDVQFNKKALFQSCKFKGRVFFKNSVFKDEINFLCSRFDYSCDFSVSEDIPEKNKNFDKAIFSGCTFSEEADFTGRRLIRVDFGSHERIDYKHPNKIKIVAKTEFHGIPKFHRCKFYQGISFDDAIFKSISGLEAARAYRTLKLAMEQLKATREEQKFFRLEMKAEHLSLPFGKRWMSTAYSLFSDYGFSLWRPLVWLLALSLLFGIGYGILANACASDAECAQIAWGANTGSTADRTSAVIKYTLASVSPVPGLDKMQAELRALLFGHHGWIPITALMLEILHKIVALVMAFLFALALRNLFKMKS